MIAPAPIEVLSPPAEHGIILSRSFEEASMRTARYAIAVLLLFALSLPAKPQEPEAEEEPAVTTPKPKGKAAAEKAKPEGKEEKPEPEETPVVTHHEIRPAGKALKYAATAGMLPIRNAEGETEAHMFFMAYTLETPPGSAPRPLTFCFNGGPGSSSVWLHLGAIGPRRVKLLPDGSMPPPPFELEDNPDTWLEQTDLVFIDPVGTGYSRPAKKELGKKFWGVKGDIESVGEFIRLYLTRYERWNSSLFLAGESYGTTRAAGLSGYLLDYGIALNGIVLVSTVLNFETLEFSRGNDLPYVFYLSSYTGTAWYHKKLPSDFEQRPLAEILPEVERWANHDYALALAQGDRLSGADRQAVVEHLARYTGLSKTYIEHANLRVRSEDFRKELLRDENRSVGRLDSRFEGIDVSGISETPDYDPSEAAVRPPFTAAFNNYVRVDLGYKSDRPYHILGGGFRNWEWGSAGEGFPNVSPDLRSAFVRNRYMKVLVLEGYYDLATPYDAVTYTLEHLGLDPSLRDNVSVERYESGHMIYINAPSLTKMKRDVSAFISSAVH